MQIQKLFPLIGWLPITKPQGGGTQHIRIRGGQSKKFSGNPKISLQLHFNPKISAHSIITNLYMNIKYPETMQVKARLPLANPEISVTRCFVSKNIMKIVLLLFGPKNITFGNILTQKYRTYLPVCACAECPPPLGTKRSTIANKGTLSE